jgi:signal transduction histidine kinase
MWNGRNPSIINMARRWLGINWLWQEFAKEKNFNAAIKYFTESDTYRAQEEGDFGRCENLINWAELYDMMGKKDLAIAYFKRGINLGKKIAYKGAVQYCYGQLTKIYEGLNKPALALQNFKREVAYKDSVMNVETNTKISELKIAYETEKKDRRISENELALKNKSLQLLVLVGALALILGLLIFSLWYYRQKQARLRKELELKTQLKQAELEKKISEEKLHISRELHDNIGSNLTFMISSLDNMAYLSKENSLQPKLQKLGEFGRETIDDLRNSIWALKKEDGDTDELIFKTNDLKRKISETLPKPEIIVENKLSQNYKLSSVQMLNLFRLIKEAVQNSIKHAQASTISISFLEKAGSFSIKIMDDGIGFDPQITEAGNGLENMKKRCDDAGGSFQIESSAKGTMVFFSKKL